MQWYLIIILIWFSLGQRLLRYIFSKILVFEPVSWNDNFKQFLNTYWKKRNTAACVLRWYDYLCRQSLKIDSKNYQTNKWTKGSSVVKNPPATQVMWVCFLDGKLLWRRKWQPSPVLLPGKSHEQRSLVGYSAWGHKRIGHDLSTKQQ